MLLLLSRNTFDIVNSGFRYQNQDCLYFTQDNSKKDDIFPIRKKKEEIKVREDKVQKDFIHTSRRVQTTIVSVC